MKIKDGFFLKNRLAMMKIARDMVITELNEKIPTITEYSDRFSISRGTVQMAIMFLVEQHGIVIQKRGHQGTILVEKNDDIVWKYTGWGSLTGAMPLPLNLLASGLATGICESMKQSKINFNCVFMQGSKTRIDALVNGKYDFVVASKLTMDILQEKYPQVEMATKLDTCYYSGRYVLLFADEKETMVRDGMTIAVDPTSIDQLYLTDLLTKDKKIKRKESTYINTYKSVIKKEVDVIVARLDILETEYPQRVYQEINGPILSRKQVIEFSETVVLTGPDNYGLKKLLQKVLYGLLIAREQRRVMAEEIPPNYY